MDGAIRVRFFALHTVYFSLIKSRKLQEEEEKSPEHRKPAQGELGSIEYVAERLLKSKPGKKVALLNFIGAMFQFQGGISDNDKETIVAELQKKKWLSIDNSGRVCYHD
jgi:hypothetical protein